MTDDATGDATDDATWFAANRAWWDERAPLHLRGEFYDVEAWLAGQTALRDFELVELGDVSGRTLVHPQCHIGTDTLSWAREGAIVTGLDLSAASIEAAGFLADQAGIDATFVCANVYDAVGALDGERFDIVYTGLGALNWLPDVTRWAEAMAALCKPGGTFYLVEFHPVCQSLDEDLVDRSLVIRYPLDEAYHEVGPPGSYGDAAAATEHNETWGRIWSLGSVMSAVIDAGFVIELFHEFDWTLAPFFPWLERDGARFILPDGVPSFPMMYSLRASLPA